MTLASALDTLGSQFGEPCKLHVGTILGKETHQGDSGPAVTRARTCPTSLAGVQAAEQILAAVKRGAALLRTSICSPVFGLRPMRALRWRTEKTPKPRNSTRSPCVRAAPISSKIVATIRSTSRIRRCGLASASRVIKSDLVMVLISTLVALHGSRAREMPIPRAAWPKRIGPTQLGVACNYHNPMGQSRDSPFSAAEP